MKTTLLKLFAIALIIFTVKNARAEKDSTRSLMARYTMDEIIIDGMADESVWTTVDAQTFDYCLGCGNPTNPSYGSGVTATVKALYRVNAPSRQLDSLFEVTDSAIYLFIDVDAAGFSPTKADPTIKAWGNSPEIGDPWEKDNIELFWDTYPGVSDFGGDAAQIRLLSGLNDSTNGGGSVYHSWERSRIIDYTTVAKAGAGFSCEVRIPLKCLMPSDWMEYFMSDLNDDVNTCNFDIAVKIAEAPDGATRSFANYTGIGDGYKDTQYMKGSFVFEKIANANVKEIEHLDVELSVYPNPASTYLMIRSSEKMMKLNVFDLLGKQVISKENLMDGQTQLDVSDLQEGLYFIRCEYRAGSISKKVLIK